MRMISTAAMVGLLALSTAAFAQQAGAPGANGASGPATGHNTPGSGVDPQQTTGGMNEGRASAPDADGTVGTGANGTMTHNNGQ